MKCPYFNRCGGCDHNGTDYSTQLESKDNTVKRILRLDSLEVYSSEPFGYRNRMDFVVRNGKIGFRQKNKWFNMVDIKHCNIANAKINELLTEIREHELPQQVKAIVIRATRKNSSVSFVVDEYIDKKKIPEIFADNIIMTKVDSESHKTSSHDHKVIKGKDLLMEDINQNNFVFSVQGFFQNNIEVAEKMHKFVTDKLKEHNTKKAHLVDLFGGVGTFGINNHKLFKKTTIIESDSASVLAAKVNIKGTDIDVVQIDAMKISSVPLEGPIYLIIDPPRSGMHQSTISYIKRLKPKMIIYISCNPNQMKKDIILLEYKIKDAALFDMFPQTNHVEVVAVLIP